MANDHDLPLKIVIFRIYVSLPRGCIWLVLQSLSPTCGCLTVSCPSRKAERLTFLLESASPWKPGTRRFWGPQLLYYIYIYIHIHTHTHTHIQNLLKSGVFNLQPAFFAASPGFQMFHVPNKPTTTQQQPIPASKLGGGLEIEVLKLPWRDMKVIPRPWPPTARTTKDEGRVNGFNGSPGWILWFMDVSGPNIQLVYRC